MLPAPSLFRILRLGVLDMRWGEPSLAVHLEVPHIPFSFNFSYSHSPFLWGHMPLSASRNISLYLVPLFFSCSPSLCLPSLRLPPSLPFFPPSTRECCTLRWADSSLFALFVWLVALISKRAEKSNNPAYRKKGLCDDPTFQGGGGMMKVISLHLFLAVKERGCLTERCVLLACVPFLS